MAGHSRADRISKLLFESDGQHSARPLDRLTLLALVYLGVPLLVFLATWLKPIYAAMGMALAAVAAVSVASRFELGRRLDYRIVDLLVIIAAGAAWSAMGGGSHFVYANPDWLVRDAIVGDLTYGAWPPSYGIRDGHHDLLRSAIGFFLPVASVAKLVGPEWLPVLMYVWTAIGTLLFLSLLPLPADGTLRLLFALAVIIAFSGMDVLGVMLLHGHYPVFPLRIEWWAEYDFRTLFSYSSLTGQLIWAPNHALPIWIATALCYRHWKHPQFMALLCLLLPSLPLSSPFALPGLAPFLLLVVLDRIRSGFSVARFPFAAFATALILGGLVIRLQMLNVGDIPMGTTAGSTTQQGTDRIDFLRNYLVFILLEFGVLGLAVFSALRHSRGLLIVALGVLSLLPLLTFGPSNDLLLRVGTPSLVFLAILCQRALCHSASIEPRRRVLIATLLLIGAHTPFNELWRAASWRAWTPDYERPFIDTQNGRLPRHYIGRLDSPSLTEILREPAAVPDRDARRDMQRGSVR